MLILQVQVLLVELELLNAQDMERKAAKDQHGCWHAQQEKHLLLQWENVANLTRYWEGSMNHRPFREECQRSVTVILVISLCWWLNVGDNSQISATKVCNILYVDNIPIGHQHHNIPECYIGHWYLMLVPRSWHATSPTSLSYHQHIWSPTSVINIDVTVQRSRNLLLKEVETLS